MDDLTIVMLGKQPYLFKDIPCKVLSFAGTDIIGCIRKINTKYVVFVRTDDIISEKYIDYVYHKISSSEFDSCFINFQIKGNDSIKIPTDEKELNTMLPTYGSYIWSFIFNTSKLLMMIDMPKDKKFDEYVKEVFQKTTCIPEIIYEHVPKKKTIFDKCFCYPDFKNSMKIKNAIYVGKGCSGTFNGYVSWVRNIGKVFSSQYEIYLIHDGLGPRIKDEFEGYFQCIERDPKVNYFCERLLVTYSDYFYPRNLIYTDRNYLFIHGNLSDYPDSRHYYDDVFTDYYAVSKVATERAKGYYPTDTIKTLYNPFVLDQKKIMPHLKLCSAHRTSPIKRTDRIEYMASILDELGIPYTWNFFTDVRENTNHNGLIYRSRVVNPFPYIADSDYFVLFSDSEALPYSIVEALSLHRKVVVTPLPAFFELGVKDGENAFVIPFDYFEEKNKKKLIDIIWKMYREIGYNDFEYEFDSDLYSGYHDIFLS